MKTFFEGLRLNRYFLGFVWLFAYAQSIQGRILVRKQVDLYIFTPEAALVTLVSACIVFIIIGFFIARRRNKMKAVGLLEAFKIFICSLLCYLLVINLISLSVALIFNTFERNFNRSVFVVSNISHVLDVCIYGSFFLAHFFYQQNKKDNEQLLAYNGALSESKITQLKAQLNPHFLFNNLNVLDQLIEEDKIKASDFLNDFAELYRYVLQASEQRLVPLEEELLFAKSYFRMMVYKYGPAYQLEVLVKENIKGFIPPLTLQLLLENAFVHNLGTPLRPVYTRIEMKGKLLVSNTLIPKETTKTFGGRALQNLREQYQLLSNESIDIVQDQLQFSVSLPLIPAQNL